MSDTRDTEKCVILDGVITASRIMPGVIKASRISPTMDDINDMVERRLKEDGYDVVRETGYPTIINTIQADRIPAGSVEATNIVAGTITVDRIVVK